MKRVVVFALMLLMLACMGAAADVPDKPNAFAYAYDFDGSVLDAADMEEIEAYGAALEEATGVQAVAVVVDFLDGMDIADYATDLINSWGIGDADEDNGVVILLARGDREIQIGTGRGIDRKLTGSKCGELIDENIEYFADNRFDEGMTALYADVCEYIAGVEGKNLSISGSSIAPAVDQNQAAESDDDGGSLFDVILGLIVAYIIISIVINAVFRNSSCCLKLFFLGWLFDKNDNGKNGGVRNNPPVNRNDPPMSGGNIDGGFSVPRGSISNTPKSGGQYKGSLFGGSAAHKSSGSFGGGSSRGGGAGRSFGGSSSSLGGGFKSGGLKSGGFKGGSFGGGSSRGGGGGRKF